MSRSLLRFARSLSAPLGAVLLAASVGPAAGDEPDRVTVKKAPFEIVLSLDGSFDQPDAVAVKARPEVYKGALEVVEAAAPGQVQAGAMLVKFDAVEMDRQIEKAALDLEIALKNFERLSRETGHKEETAAIQLATAEMAWEKSRQTLENFREVLMPMRIEEAELSLQSSKDRLKDEEEQFEQLQKMYKSDDLVEETEEIVLNRARRGLEQQRKQMTFTLRRHELQMEVEFPRELQGYEFALRKATNDFGLAKATHELGLELAHGELEKAERALDQQESELGRLRGDRAFLEITAPSGGLAVRGELAKGKWTKLATEPGGLKAGSKVSANQVLYTIVQAGPRVVRTVVKEASILEVEPGQTAMIAPTATPGARLEAKVRRVAPVSTDGRFEVWLQLEEGDSRLLPGNACKIELTTLHEPDALLVPESAVRRDGDRATVHVWKNGASRPREVELGRTHKKKVQVLSGLKAGEQVLKVAPAGAQ